MWEFSAKKNDGPKDQIPAIEDGELKTVNEFDYYSSDMNALKLGKPPYFLKVSKIREIIFVSEGACSIGDYRERINALYRAGYAESLAQKDNLRLLILEELEAVGQFSWGCVFGTSSQERIKIAKQWSKYL